MKVLGLDHVSIATARLEETRAFYCDVLGLAVGPRPAALKSEGYWLYAGDKALIHLVARPDKPPAPAAEADLAQSGLDDHIALAVDDAAGLVEAIRARGLAYWDRLLADRGLYQVFVRDPNGVVVEINDAAPDLDRLSPMAVQGAE